MGNKGIIRKTDMQAVDSNYHLAIDGGTVTLDGSNPTTITTKLASVTSAVFGYQGAVVPTVGDDGMNFTYTASGGVISLYAWEQNVTSGILQATADSTTVVSWIAVGT